MFHLLSSVIILLLSMSFVNSTHGNSCKIKMANNRMAFAKSEKLIFNEGVLDAQSYSENAVDPHITPADNLLEYFYIFEDKLVNRHENHDRIKTLASSSDVNILLVEAEVKSGGSEFKESFDMSEIEVKYSCIQGKTGKIKISMIVTSDQCDPFTIHWYKECKSSPTVSPSNITPSAEHSKTTVISSLNIGMFHKGDDIVKEGKFLSKGGDHSMAITIPANVPTITLYFTTKPGSLIIMNEPDTILNEENLVPILRGELRKGGILSEIPQSLTIAMACTSLKISKTDIQLKLSFEKDQKLNLFFNKECDTTSEIEEYFSILTLIYWVFVILIAIFLITVFIYYLNKNELTVFDLIDKVKEFANYYINKYLSKDRWSSLGHQRELTQTNETERIGKEKLVVDDHLDNDEPIDIKISGGNEIKEKSNQHSNSNAANMDYGGI